MRAVLPLIAAWTTLAALFGTQLFFSLNRSIANPIVNPLVPATKDALWIATLILIVALVWQPRRKLYGRQFLFWCAAGIFGFASLLLATYCRSGCDYVVFALLKNVLMYWLGGLLLGYIVANIDLEIGAIRIILAAILIALCASIALFVFIEFEFKVHEWRRNPDVPALRMFGTFGNPNSAGWAAVLAASLSLLAPQLLRNSTVRKDIISQFVMLVIAFVALFFSSSLSALLGMLVTILISLAFIGSDFHRLRVQIATVMLAGATGFGLATLLVNVATPGHDLDVVTRVLSVLGGRSTDSIDVRVVDYSDVWERGRGRSAVIGGGGDFSPIFRQYDSITLTLLNNFGLLGTVLVMLPCIYVLSLLLQRSHWKTLGQPAAKLVWRGYVPLYVSFIIVNAFLQHQLQVFPLNFFFAFLTGLWVTSVDRARGRPFKPER